MCNIPKISIFFLAIINSVKGRLSNDPAYFIYAKICTVTLAFGLTADVLTACDKKYDEIPNDFLSIRDYLGTICIHVEDEYKVDKERSLCITLLPLELMIWGLKKKMCALYLQSFV